MVSSLLLTAFIRDSVSCINFRRYLTRVITSSMLRTTRLITFTGRLDCVRLLLRLLDAYDMLWTLSVSLIIECEDVA